MISRAARIHNKSDMGVIGMHGLAIAIENPSYTTREGVGSDGQPWSTLLQHAYGEVTHHIGADGDGVDCFLGPDLDSETAFIINQNEPVSGDFDEHKVMLGFNSLDDAHAAYMQNYQPGWGGFGSIYPAPIPNFKEWLSDGDKSRPYKTDWFPEPGLAGAAGDATLSKDDLNRMTLARFSCPYCNKTFNVAMGKDREKCPTCGSDTDRIEPGIAGKEKAESAAADAKWSQAVREAYHKEQPENFAGPDLTFPIKDQDDVDHAARLSGHAADPDVVKSKIKSIAKRLGLSTPDSWKAEKPKTEAAVDSCEDGETCEIFFAATDTWQVVTDAADSEGLMDVRQLAMLVEPHINLNGRYIPREVAIPALTDAAKRARSGAMLSEYRHPKIVKNTDGGDGFVDNFDRKTSRIKDVELPNDNGEVWITRRILDTEPGRAVADSFRKGSPNGLSTRMLAHYSMENVGGRKVQKFKKFRVSTWDDMAPGELPAVPETRDNYQLLTDEMRRDLDTVDTAPPSNEDAAAGHSGQPDNPTTAASDAASNKEKTMNPELKAALDSYRLAYATGDRAEIATARQDLQDELRRARKKKLAEPEELATAAKEMAQIDSSVQLAGLFPDRPAPIGVTGNDTGPGAGSTPNGPGYAPDLEKNAMPQGADQVEDNKTKPPMRDGDGLDGDANKNSGTKNPDGTKGTMDAADHAEMQEILAERRAKRTGEERDKAVADALTEHAPEVLKGLPAEAQEAIVDTLRRYATDPASVPSLLAAQLDIYSKAVARERLKAGGMPSTLRGQTTNDPASPRVSDSQDRPSSLMQEVEKLLAAADSSHRSSSEGPDPEDPRVQAVRKYNRREGGLIDRMIQQMDIVRQRSHSPQSFTAALDSYNNNDGEQALCDLWDKMSSASGAGRAVVDTTTLSDFYNMPTISIALIIQMFQDLTALQWVDSIGPGDTKNVQWEQTNDGTYEPGRTGWVLKIPTETYQTPSGSGTLSLRPFDTYDAGLLNPEGAGIPSGKVSVVWLPFATLPRQIAATISRPVRAAAGLGPLNYDQIGRHLYHIGADKNRRIDKALYDEQILVSDEYQAVAVSSESVDLTHNSSYNAAGSVVVNLNPAKAANAAPVGADPYIMYGPNVVGAVRLAAGGGVYTSGGYFGSAYGATPVLPPRTVFDLASNGQYTSSVQHPLTLVAPASQPQGYIDNMGQVQTLPQTWGQASAPGTGTWAPDYEIGVLVFTAGSGITGSGTLITSAVTVSYSYSTNFDNFVAVSGGNVLQTSPLTPAQVGVLVNGLADVNMYYGQLLAQVGVTGALLSSQSRYSRPNMALMSMNIAELIARAREFAPLYQPPGTQLYPTPDQFAERNGIMFGRHNSPWNCGDRRMLVSRRGATKYGVGLPAQVSGPYPTYDTSTGAVKAMDTMYLEEYSVIGTPLPTDPSGNTYNPPSRSILLRGPNG